jgi:hypothetical protein
MRITEWFTKGVLRSPRGAIGRSFLVFLQCFPLACCGAPDFSHSCIDTPKKEFRDPSGVQISIVDTACDTLGNDLSESIFASQGPSTPKQLLFKYGPDERSQLPRVSVRDGNVIVISVDSILDVIFQATRYGSYTIVYEVKHIEYN